MCPSQRQWIINLTLFFASHLFYVVCRYSLKLIRYMMIKMGAKHFLKDNEYSQIPTEIRSICAGKTVNVMLLFCVYVCLHTCLPTNTLYTAWCWLWMHRNCREAKQLLSVLVFFFLKMLIACSPGGL